MNIMELIERLEELVAEYGQDLEVRIAEQPNWPFENEISQVEAVNLSDQKCDVCDGEGGDGEETCPDCDGTGKYRKDGKTEDEWIIYLAQGNQIGYLPGVAAEALGWR